MYDMVLIEKPIEEGLCRSDILKMLDNLKTDDLYPIEIDNKRGESVAMGFITSGYADTFNYDYAMLNEYIGDILADMELETQSHEYVLERGKILLTR